jgi:flagellar biosynthesis protein FlhF
MKLRKYRAPTEADAFRQIKADLGPDAIVLSVRQVRPRGMWGVFSRQREVEVTAAADLLADSRPRPALPPPRPVSRPRAAPLARDDEGVALPVEPSRARQEYSEIRSTLTEITTALNHLTSGGPDGGPAIDGPRPELLHGNLREAHRRLIEQDVDPLLVQRLIGAVREELSPRALEDRHTVADCLRRHVAHLIRRPEPIAIPAGLPVSLFLIGPTGVGKTTTIAKLAARFALLERQRVALVTVDTFRIAAAEQLRIYAEIIGLPLEVAYTTADLAAAVHRHRDKDVILVDTPGRSQRHSAHLQELHAFLQAVPRRLVYLTVDAGTRHADLLEITERFAPRQLDGLVVTKIDETTQFGTLLNLADHTNCPLVYLTYGQEVPDDIEEVTADRVTELVLGGTA